MKAPKYIQLNTKNKTIKVGKIFALKVKLSSKSAGNVRFTSSNPKAVSVASNGKLKALKKGKAVITARTYNNKKAVIKVTVK